MENELDTYLVMVVVNPLSSLEVGNVAAGGQK